MSEELTVIWHGGLKDPTTPGTLSAQRAAASETQTYHAPKRSLGHWRAAVLSAMRKRATVTRQHLAERHGVPVSALCIVLPDLLRDGKIEIAEKAQGPNGGRGLHYYRLKRP